MLIIDTNSSREIEYQENAEDRKRKERRMRKWRKSRSVITLEMGVCVCVCVCVCSICTILELISSRMIVNVAIKQHVDHHVSVLKSKRKAEIPINFKRRRCVGHT